MIDPFMKRVELLEKWHNDLSKDLTDIGDLAELIAEVWQESEDRVIRVIDDPMYADLSKVHLIGVIQGASLDGEWD